MVGTDFSIEGGVRQGAVEAPLLWNLYLEFVLRQVEATLGKTVGIRIMFRSKLGLDWKEWKPDKESTVDVCR